MRPLHWSDFAFGLFLIAFSGLVFYAIRPLALGSAVDMGPGYVPRVLAIILFTAGIYQCFRGFFDKVEPFPKFIWRPLLAVIASGAAFALALSKLGLIIAIIASMVIAHYAAPPFCFKEIVLAQS